MAAAAAAFCKLRSNTWDYNVTLAGFPVTGTELTPRDIKNITKSLAKHSSIPSRNLKCLYRGTSSPVPDMTMFPDSKHHLNMFDAGVPIYVGHPISTSTKRSISKEFGGKGAYLHVISFPQRPKLRESIAIVDTLDPEILSTCVQFWGKTIKDTDQLQGVIANARREHEILVLPGVYLSPAGRKGKTLRWVIMPSL